MPEFSAGVFECVRNTICIYYSYCCRHPHVFCKHRTKGSSFCSKLMVQLLCKDSRRHRERLGGTRELWDKIAWAAVVRPLQTMIICVCLMLIRGK